MTIEVSAEHAGARLDTFLGRALGLSRRTAQEAISSGGVRINGRRAPKGSTVQAGDQVEVPDATLEPKVLPPNPDLQIEILYEDSQLVAIDKPAGLPSLALSAEETATVGNFLVDRYPEMTAIGRNALEPGIVHRLDTGTSGILLAARTPDAYERLRQQFSQHLVEKEYVAVVFGNVLEPASVEAPLAPHTRDGRKMRIVEVGSKGAQRASTSYRPLQSNRERSLLAVRIKTGVRHQIRVHLAAVGHAVVGDQLYGPRQPNIGRHLLHACYVAFTHPTRGDRIEIRSAPPPEFVLKRPRPAAPKHASREASRTRR